MWTNSWGEAEGEGPRIPFFVFWSNNYGNVSWRRRAQIKQLAWPMAELQIGHRKSCLVFSVCFPVVNWRSRTDAKWAYYFFHNQEECQILSNLQILAQFFIQNDFIDLLFFY